MTRFQRIKTSHILFAQLAVSGIAIGFLAWLSISVIKKIYYYSHPLRVNSWTFTYFHPEDSALFNYLFLCLVFGFLGLAFYNRWVIARFYKCGKNLPLLIRVLALFLSILILAVSTLLPLLYKSVALLFIASVPLIHLISLPSARVTKWLCLGFTVFVLSLLCWQVIQIVRGPVYLMSEYPKLSSNTIVNGVPIDNRKFLEGMDNDNAEVIRYFLGKVKSNIEKNKKTVLKHLPEDQGVVDFLLRTFKYENLNYWKTVIISQAPFNGSEESLPGTGKFIDRTFFVDRLQRLDMETIKKFQFANQLEYNHQNMGRGQINHIGHILNPLNEYESGKPEQEVYWQYGWGNTLLMKWVMSLFGGISLHGYYKCYFFYIVYFLLSLAVLYVVFRDPVSLGGTFAFFAIAFFYLGYIAFVLAPGLIPSIRLFDTIVLLPLLFFFQSRRAIPLFFVFALMIISLLINSRFGLMLMGAVYLSILLYIYENSKQRIWHIILFTTCVAAVAALVFGITPRGPAGFTNYYLMGFFSWEPKAVIVAFTMIYLVVSYLFLIALRNHRFPFKYLYVFVFFYTQGLFVYFYWSGLLNHFPIVIPWMGIQLFLMFHIVKSIGDDKSLWVRYVELARYGTVCLAMVLVLGCALKFYIEKDSFQRNFTQHQTYHWQFARADLISTIDPAPLQEAISLLHKYGGNSRGVFIISQYDQFLPFLAGKYSAMPHFELPYYLVSAKEEKITVDRIRQEKPQYIFADSGISSPLKLETFDPWAGLFDGRFSSEERKSRFGRMLVIQKVFNAISGDYVKIKDGRLISVYKRI